ncbi:MAG: hypothetical protein IKM52_02915 [Clostridia bacterium]|nr:hypothetical protein [Clostridia bacterium]
MKIDLLFNGNCYGEYGICEMLANTVVSGGRACGRVIDHSHHAGRNFVVLCAWRET